MSGMLGIVTAAAAAASATPDPIAYNDVSLAVPALDGGRGIQAAVERWLPTQRVSVAGSVELREAAVGDYTGIRVGVGAEVRWYWRADGWLSRQPKGSMVGWFVGGRLGIALDATHDRADARWLGTALELQGTWLLGYRIAPWRGLEITPSAGLGIREDFDLSGRLGHVQRYTLAVGLAVGWMF